MDEGAVGVTSLSTVISVIDENASAPLLDPEQGNEVGSAPLQGNRVSYRVKHKHWACAHEDNNSTEEGMQKKKKNNSWLGFQKWVEYILAEYIAFSTALARVQLSMPLTGLVVKIFF